MTEQNTSEVRSLLTIKQFTQHHPAFTEGGLRHLIFYADTNGLGGVLCPMGDKYQNEFQ